MITHFILLSFLLFSFCHSKDNLIVNMQENIRLLKEENNFNFIDLELSSKQVESFEALHIESFEIYHRFGNLELIQDELPQFLRQIGNAEEKLIQEITKCLVKIVYSVKDAANKDSAWVTIRAYPLNPFFDTPRWHYDGYFFSNTKEKQYKFGAALKGPATLFYLLTKDERAIFELNSEDQEFLNSFLDRNKAETAKKGFGSFFIVGDPPYAAIHSEPKMNENRLFISVVPGNEAEIQELYMRMHEGVL